MSKTPMYNTWQNMRARCTNPNHPAYDRYGGRGISVCAEWSDFEAFKKWSMASGYKPGLSIERVDGERGYNPDNCTWANDEVQARNRSNVSKADDGTPWFIIAERNGIGRGVFYARVHNGWSRQDAATRPKFSRTPSPPYGPS